jgi:2-haloacid dehalogenase
MEHLIDRVITAEDIGVYKPNREAFMRAYKMLGVRYDEAIHISSYPQYDLEPARSLGIRAIHLNRYGYTWEPSINSLEEIVDLLRD